MLAERAVGLERGLAAERELARAVTAEQRQRLDAPALFDGEARAPVFDGEHERVAVLLDATIRMFFGAERQYLHDRRF